jgi:hypothetical protein
VSNANAGSAADANSRTNSPGDTATAMPVSPTVNSQASIPTTPSHHKLPENVSGYDDCTGLSESAKVNHIRNCYGYGDPMPVPAPTSIFQQPDTPQSLQLIQQQNPYATKTKTTEACIDNTGSAQDSGYAQGYVDGNRDSVNLNGHGFDDSLHGNHTPEFRQGYHDGYQAGFRDGNNGINLQPC